MTDKPPQSKKSVLIVAPTTSEAHILEGGEETEVAAQVSLPQEGGWGWVVVFVSFYCVFVLDGVVYTFGALLPDMIADFKVSDSLLALVNSVAAGLYLTLGPLASAFINRFGFRSCVMTGSVITSISLFVTYFAPSYIYLIIFYGVCTGVGASLINMSSSLVVGFYFEKLRSIVLAISSCGTSFGVMIFFPLNDYLVRLAGWRTTTLFHTSLIGIIFFVGMTFRPLVSVTVVMTTDNEPTRTTAYLPSIANMTSQSRSKLDKEPTLKPTKAEKMFGAVSNINFPTAAIVVDEGIKVVAASPPPTSQPGTSAAAGAVSKITIIANKPEGGLSRRQLKQVQSIAVIGDQTDQMNIAVEIPEIQPKIKKGCWGRFCKWESHVAESRPLYRDDAFYDGRVDKLPQYQKSMINAGETKTGIEYQLAVSRATATSDLKENRGVFTTAARRVLATMLDPALLKKTSFLLMCFWGCLSYLGLLVPYVYIRDRNQSERMDPAHCSLFVSAIGLSNAIGRIVLGVLAVKVDALVLCSISMITAGVATMLSNISFNVYFQYAYCCIFGFFTSSITLRSIVLVSMYGLDKLTNATGMVVMFQGIASIFGTPMAAAIKDAFGYTASFVVAGAFVTSSGIVLCFVKLVQCKEAKREKNRKELKNERNKITT